MKVVIQRVKSASTTIEGRVHSSIGQGLLMLFGVSVEDTHKDADYLAEKISKLRIFPDQQGDMNVDIKQIDGDLLVVSQFTLLASTRKGNRPSFIAAARPDTARELYEYFCKKLETLAQREVKTGVFGADTEVALINDGPVTILIDSNEK